MTRPDYKAVADDLALRRQALASELTQLDEAIRVLRRLSGEDEAKPPAPTPITYPGRHKARGAKNPHGRPPAWTKPAEVLPEHGKRLRELREGLRWSQAKAARETGLSQSAISGMETGKIPVPDELLASLKKRFGDRVLGAAS